MLVINTLNTLLNMVTDLDFAIAGIPCWVDKESEINMPISRTLKFLNLYTMTGESGVVGCAFALETATANNNVKSMFLRVIVVKNRDCAPNVYALM